MRILPSLLAAGCATLFATVTPVTDLEWINRLDAVVHQRFEDPMPLYLGMSRIAGPPSLGEHFHPDITLIRDFHPARPAELTMITALEERKMQIGLYLFGAAIVDSAAADLNYRALKGPAAMTRGTPRPDWYPLLQTHLVADSGALPDWKAIYPLARKAMASFEDGGRGFETVLAGWNLAVRPVLASQERCVSCHNAQGYRPSHTIKLNDTIGGALYAYRHAGS